MLRLPPAPALAVALVGLVGLGMGLLGGCGDSAAGTYNDADVTFASEMTAHHEQAVAMVAMTDDRDVDPAFRDLADGIRGAQQPEIDEMTGWLESWGKPTPEASGDPDDSTDEMNMGGSMAGMMSADEMAELADAPDAAFEQLWLRLMVKHHQGALAMARTEVDDGRFPDAVALARRIDDTQTDEIAEMQALLAP